MTHSEPLACWTCGARVNEFCTDVKCDRVPDHLSRKILRRCRRAYYYIFRPSAQFERDRLLHQRLLAKSPRYRRLFGGSPALRDLRGIAPDLTGGLSAEDFVRQLRDRA